MTSVRHINQNEKADVHNIECVVHSPSGALVLSTTDLPTTLKEIKENNELIVLVL